MLLGTCTYKIECREEKNEKISCSFIILYIFLFHIASRLLNVKFSISHSTSSQDTAHKIQSYQRNVLWFMLVQRAWFKFKKKKRRHRSWVPMCQSDYHLLKVRKIAFLHVIGEFCFLISLPLSTVFNSAERSISEKLKKIELHRKKSNLRSMSFTNIYFHFSFYNISCFILSVVNHTHRYHINIIHTRKLREKI